MAKKHRRKKSILRSRFYQVYFALILLFIIGMAFGMRYLKNVLADYESSQPKYTAADAAALFERGDYEAIADLDTNMSAISNGDREFYVQSMRALADGKTVEWSEAYSPSEDERVYRVMLDGEKFAQFKLVPSGQTTERGNRLWSLASITSFVSLSQSTPEPTPEPVATPEPIVCSVLAPSNYSVFVDDRLLDANDVVQADISIVPEGMLPEDMNVPVMLRYAFYSNTDAPEMRILDALGNEQTFESTGAYEWRCDLPQHPELKELYEAGVVKVAQAIAKYSTRLGSKNGVLKYCAKNSPAYVSIQNLDPSMGKKPDSVEFKNVQTSDYCLYSENCFSCKVCFDYIANFKGKYKESPTSYIMYFVRQNDEGKLYNFTLG